MDTSQQFPLNALPVELQREIFILAANHDRGSAVRLVLVARRVYAWLHPRIYDMVTLGSNDTAMFLRTMQSLPDNFLSTNVKRLCLSVSVSGRDAERILTVCTGTIDLAFWVDWMSSPPSRSLAPFLSPLRLQRLSVELRHFDSLFADQEVRHAWSNTLTHLDIIFWTHELSPAIPHLDRLPSLTHLAMRLRHNQAHEDSLLSILSACRNLKILIIYDESDSAEETIWATDRRVVYMPYPTNVVHDWEAQARQDESCSWSRAEELVRRYATEHERPSTA